MLGNNILEYKDALADGAFAAELQKSGHWVIAYIDPAMAWPVRVQKVTFLSQEFWIIPITTNAYPGVAVRARGAGNGELRERISRFLSVLSWIDNHGVLIKSFGGGSYPFAFSRRSERGLTVCDQLDLSYLPEVSDPKAMLALALMREGRALRHVAYSFLSFWRVLEVAIGRKKIKAWVVDAVNRVTEPQAREAIGKIRASGVADVADHLYVSGRCAIAHAGSNPIVDPDQPEDSRRLYEERPLVEALAVLSIEEKLGVKTSSTVYREHLYELAGFKRIFGCQLVNRILNRDEITEDTVVDVPNIDFRLINRETLVSFKRLMPINFGRDDDGRVLMEFGRSDGRLRVVFCLNFDEERLEFDIQNGLYGPQDDGSPEYADIHADIHEFGKWYYLNGRLEIIDSETGEQIARKDAFIPVNVIVEPEGFDRDIEQWRTEAQKRRDPSEP